ncbi:hypothetical protein GCM10022280_20220 [Sphingomonas swuensis]|uniref:Magnesium chelatase family protein n=1 Tax=Sphingomonas swuensis TaxID=977800 RepID=A0ABP7T271_9SPHN
MVATVGTVAYLGLEARAVEVQVQLSTGLPRFVIVGLPDKAVAESRERVRAALTAIGLALPPKVITVNLSPADLPKEGSHFDLPIALALLAAVGATDAEMLSHYVAVGELCLDGRIAASPGVLLAALHAAGEGKGLICPVAQGPEAAWAGEVEVLAAPDLLGLLAHLRGTTLLPAPPIGEAEPAVGGPDLGDPGLACARAPRCAADYQARVSGPLLDRIDLHVEVAGVSAADLSLPPPAEGSEAVAQRVARARAVQGARFNGHGPRTNAEADGELLDEVATPDEPGRRLLADAAAAMRLSARGYHRVLRVARTIADLAGAEGVGRIHVAEALSYRRVTPRN